MSHKLKGQLKAEWVIAKASHDRIVYWLEEAKRGRQRWWMLLFKPSKRRFLDGFIETLEAHLNPAPKPDPATRSSRRSSSRSRRG